MEIFFFFFWGIILVGFEEMVGGLLGVVGSKCQGLVVVRDYLWGVGCVHCAGFVGNYL
jgi:hypothetical protein